jgi:hypothetical protein
MAMWDKLGGDELVSDLPSSVAGVAAYRTYGSLAPLADTDVTITSDATSMTATAVTAVVSLAAIGIAVVF